MFDTDPKLSTDHFFMARMLSDESLKLILPNFLTYYFDQIYYGKSLMRYPTNPVLSKLLDKFETTEQAYIIEIVVGKGNNSQVAGHRPVLLSTLNILEKEVHCRLIVETEAVVYAVFDIAGIIEEYKQYDEFSAKSKPPPPPAGVPSLDLNRPAFVPNLKPLPSDKI
jgi:hypothetical protein